MDKQDEVLKTEADAEAARLEEARRQEEAREAIVRLEQALEVNPKDVEALNELQRAYRVVGDHERREAVMRRMMAIPSKRDMKDMAKVFVAAVGACAADERVDVDRLRKEHALIFEMVESRHEIRPGVIMEVTGVAVPSPLTCLRHFGGWASSRVRMTWGCAMSSRRCRRAS